MVLSRQAQVLNRPEMDLTVPVVAADVYDIVLLQARGTGRSIRRSPAVLTGCAPM